MDPDRSSAKLASLSGMVFTVSYFVGNALLVGSITQSDSLGTAEKTFNEQADNFDLGAFLLLLGIPFLLFFAQTLRSTLARAEGAAGTTSSLALVATAAGAATTLTGAALMGGTSFLAEAATVDGRTAAFAHSAAEACIFYAMVFFGVLALTTALITLRHEVFPRWFGWLAAVLGVGMVVGGAASPLIRSLALVAGLSTYLFFLIGSFVVWKFSGDFLARSHETTADGSSAS
jgi:hypothetical protein